jgi:tetratricopeptide (TPR) repeat protein
VLVPLLVLGSIELGLRLGGFGYPTDFFKPIRIGTEDYLVENDKFGLRFFPPELSRSPPPVVMKARKPAGTYRIFILGESAALGDPRPAYGAGRYLEVLLRNRFPATRFEVICAAMTAINSHVLVPIARECAQHDGDLWIIYMGNNEMIGPFGPATVFGPQTPPLAYIRLSLALQKTRLGQLLVVAGRKLKRRSTEANRWAGMEMFLNHQLAPTDPRKLPVYRNFEANLRDILRAGLGAGVKVILSSVAVNLKDCPPFGSVDEPDLPADKRAAWDKLFAQATTAQAGGDGAQAASLYAQTAKLEPDSADLHYRWGECLLRQGDSSAARTHFELARDLDTLPFRTDSRLNDTLAKVGHEFSSRGGVAWFDAAALFSKVSPSGSPGAESFYEHVHFNFEGNYHLARAWAEQVFALLPQALTRQTAADWSSQEACERLLGLTDWNRASIVEDLMLRLNQPPFTSQLNQTSRLEGLQARLQELRQRMNKAEAVKAREVYGQAIALSPDDHRLHANFAEFLEAVGSFKEAGEEWEQVRNLIPQHHLGYFEAGHLLLRQGRLAEAQSRLLQAVALRPDLSEGWLELGKLHDLEGKTELALSEYERARTLLPQDYRVHYFLGKALSKLGRRAEAINSLRQSIRLRPAYWEAHYALGEELAYDGKPIEAQSQLEETIRLKPDYPLAHLNLGVALGAQGQWQNALREFEETARLDPQNQMATDYIHKVRVQLGLKP